MPSLSRSILDSALNVNDRNRDLSLARDVEEQAAPLRQALSFNVPDLGTLLGSNAPASVQQPAAPAPAQPSGPFGFAPVSFALPDIDTLIGRPKPQPAAIQQPAQMPQAEGTRVPATPSGSPAAMPTGVGASAAPEPSAPPPTHVPASPPASARGEIDNSSRQSFVRTAWPYVLEAAGGDRNLAELMLAKAISENGSIGTGRPIWANNFCYDGATEVLTLGGWRPWPNATLGDVFATLNPESGAIEYQRASHLTRAHYAGEMFRVETGGVDLLVTPEHRMWVRPSPGAPYQIIRARDLSDRVVEYMSPPLPPGDLADGAGVNPELLADGAPRHAARDHSPDLQHLRLGQLGVVPHLTMNVAALRSHVGHVGRLRSFKEVVRAYAGRVVANVADLLLGRQLHGVGNLERDAMSAAQPRTLLTERPVPLRVGVRHPYPAGPEIGADNRAVLVDLGPEALLPRAEVGSPAVARAETSVALLDVLPRRAEVESANFADTWNGTMGGHRLVPPGGVLPRPSEPRHGAFRRKNYTASGAWVPFDGMVYCATVPNGLLVVRRNGKAVISGNSGIKGEGDAGSVEADTWESVNGQRVNIRDKFAAYSSPTAGFAAFMTFLRDNRRYHPALARYEQTKDADQLMRDINAAGYATDPDWAEKVRSIRDSQVAPLVRSAPSASAAPGDEGMMLRAGADMPDAARSAGDQKRARLMAAQEDGGTFRDVSGRPRDVDGTSGGTLAGRPDDDLMYRAPLDPNPEAASPATAPVDPDAYDPSWLQSAPAVNPVTGEPTGLSPLPGQAQARPQADLSAQGEVQAGASYGPTAYDTPPATYAPPLTHQAADPARWEQAEESTPPWVREPYGPPMPAMPDTRRVEYPHLLPESRFPQLAGAAGVAPAPEVRIPRAEYAEAREAGVPIAYAPQGPVQGPPAPAPSAAERIAGGTYGREVAGKATGDGLTPFDILSLPDDARDALIDLVYDASPATVAAARAAGSRLTGQATGGFADMVESLVNPHKREGARAALGITLGLPLALGADRIRKAGGAAGRIVGELLDPGGKVAEAGLRAAGRGARAAGDAWQQGRQVARELNAADAQGAPAYAALGAVPDPYVPAQSAGEMVGRIREVDMVSPQTMLGIIGDRPEYLDGVASYMLDQRAKVTQGRMTPRDVAKAYYMTVASQGSDAVSREIIEAKVPGFKIPDQFVDASGKVRPEEAAAAWLFSPSGQRALDDIERGIFNPDAWAEGSAVRRAFGDDRFRTTNVFSERAPINPRRQFNMTNLNAFAEQFNQAAQAGDLAAIDRLAGRLNGVAAGKLGFLKHALGFGETPTIDAVEINAWLTGRGDTRRMRTPSAQMVGDIRTWLKDRSVGEALRGRITDAFADMQARMTPEQKAGLPDEIFNHVLHHWIWDRMKGTATTHEGFYDAMRHAATLGTLPEAGTTGGAGALGTVNRALGQGLASAASGSITGTFNAQANPDDPNAFATGFVAGAVGPAAVARGARAAARRAGAATDAGGAALRGVFGDAGATPPSRPTLEVLQQRLERVGREIDRLAPDDPLREELTDLYWRLESERIDAFNARRALEPAIRSDVGRRVESFNLTEESSDTLADAMRPRERVSPQDAADLGGPASVPVGMAGRANAVMPFDPASAAAGGLAGAASGEEGEEADPLRAGAGMLVAGMLGRKRLSKAEREALERAAKAADARPRPSGLGNVPPSAMREPTLPGMEPPYVRPNLPDISEEASGPRSLADMVGSREQQGGLPSFDRIDPLTDPASPPAPADRRQVPQRGIREALPGILRAMNEPPPRIRATPGQDARLPNMDAPPGTFRRIAGAVADAVAPWADRVGIIRYAGMLSSASGQFANVAGAATMQAVDIAATPIAAGLDMARSAVTVTPRQVFMSEVPARVRGMRTGAAVGLQAALDVLRKGLTPDDAAKMEQRAGFGTNIPRLAPEGSRAAGAVDFAFEAPLRGIAAADAVFRTMAQGGHLMAEATAAATRANGGKPPTAEMIREAAKDPALLERVQYLAKRTVLQEDRMVTNWYRDAMRYRPSDPVERMAADALRAGVAVEVPFVRTPYNVVAQGMGLTPAGLLGVVQDVKQGKAAREVEYRLARVMLGTAVMAGAAADYAAGNLTGPYPTDQKEASTLPPGWRPWSRKFTVGGETYYVPLAPLAPLALPAVVAILAGEAHKKGKAALSPDWAGQIALGIGRYAVQETFLEGVSNVGKLLDERTGERWLGRHFEGIAAQFSPHVVGGGALGNEIQRVMNMPARDPEGMLEALLATHPLTADRVEPRQDVLGRPASRGLGGPAGAVIRAGVDDDAAVIRAFRRAGEGLPMRAPEQVRDPVLERSRTLSTAQQHRWRRAFGAALQEEFRNEGRPTDAKSLIGIEQRARERATATVLGVR